MTAQVPPAGAYEYYQPDYQATSSPRTLTVRGGCRSEPLIPRDGATGYRQSETTTSPFGQMAAMSAAEQAETWVCPAPQAAIDEQVQVRGQPVVMQQSCPLVGAGQAAARVPVS